MGVKQVADNKLEAKYQRVSRNADIDINNIILTAGTDRNIRFITLGNGFENKDGFLQEFDSYNCYHLSNMDNQYTNFTLSYLIDTCILKESIA